MFHTLHLTQYIYSLCETLGLFWRRHPALLYGLSILLGLEIAFSQGLHLLLPLFFLWLPALLSTPLQKDPLRPRLLLSLCLLLSTIFYANMSYRLPELPSKGIHGMAHLEITSVTHNQMSQTWLYRGNIRTFFPEGSLQTSLAKNLPCILCFKGKQTRIPATCDYWIEGDLVQKNKNHYMLKSSGNKCIPLSKTTSFAEIRFHIKAAIKRMIHKNIKEETSAEFLSGLFVGECDHSLLFFELSRLGLQHVLAISGFHFGAVVLLLGLIAKSILKPLYAALALIIALTLYFTVLGPTPSIERAWITATVFLGSYFVKKRVNALNSLGIGLIVVTLTNPLAITQLGFRLSFLATASILLFYRPIENALNYLFKQRELSDVSMMNHWQQYGYLALSFFRKAMALNLSVQVTTIPVVLYFFHQFPLISLVYNLFFPLLVTLSLFFLLLAMSLGWVPYLGLSLYALTGEYTRTILQLATHSPLAISTPLRLTSLSLYPLVAYLTLLFLMGIFLHKRSIQAPPIFHGS